MEPLYEDVNKLPSAVEHQEQELELRENVSRMGNGHHSSNSRYICTTDKELGGN